MKVSLVTSPHLDHSRFHSQNPSTEGAGRSRLAQSFVPMGLLSIANAVETRDVELLDINKAINSGLLPMSRLFYETAAEWLLDSSPDLVGFMTEADSYHHLIRILQSVKARQPHVLTLLGGVQATAAHYETVQDFSAVDLVVRGEGEIPFRHLVESLEKGLPLSGVPNLTFRNGSFVETTPEASLIEDLDRLPFPWLSKWRLSAEDVIYLEIGRGCPFKCNFCFTAPYWKRQHRIKTPQRIMAELAYFSHEYGRKDFNFTHDLFTTDRHWVINFCRELVNNQVDVSWTCSSRTDTLDEEQIYWMQLAGCRDIYFGVETGTAEMQTRIDKDLDLHKAREIIGKTIDAGIGATIGFIAGLPGETQRTLGGTLNEAFHYLGLKTTVVHLFGFSPYKGSPHFERIRDNLIFDEHFIDFPLSEETHRDNCAFMRDHFELFSRYCRSASFEDLDGSIVRAAEEYFPIMNAIRALMSALRDRRIDNLDMLRRWTEWIGEVNRIRRSNPAGRYQGTISDFLDFLELYLQHIGKYDEITEELIRWEKYKNTIRSQAAGGVSGSSPLASDGVVFTNPSIHAAQFHHAPRILERQDGGLFAFYVRRNATPAIVRLGDLGAVILDLAKNGIPRDSLLLTLTEGWPTTASTLSQVASVVNNLQEADLILCHRDL